MFRPKRPILELRSPGLFGLVLLSWLAACGGRDSGSTRLDLESRRPVEMASFYLGAYGSPDQVAAAITDEGRGLDLDIIGEFAPGVHAALQAAGDDGLITLDEFTSAASAGYYTAIEAPQNLGAFRDQMGQGVGWLNHEVSGSMTRFRRRMGIREEAVRAALLSGEMVYPVGTVITGEHLEDGNLHETTAMIKRADGFWDYVAYDEQGALSASIDGDPDRLRIPQDCFGCHYGSRLFEPERSFPGEARPGPNGERSIYVGQEHRRADAVRYLDEHRKRSDGVLGLYGTLYLSELLNRYDRRESIDSASTALVQAVRGL